MPLRTVPNLLSARYPKKVARAAADGGRRVAPQGNAFGTDTVPTLTPTVAHLLVERRARHVAILGVVRGDAAVAGRAVVVPFGVGRVARAHTIRHAADAVPTARVGYPAGAYLVAL